MDSRAVFGLIAHTAPTASLVQPCRPTRSCTPDRMMLASLRSSARWLRQAYNHMSVCKSVMPATGKAQCLLQQVIKGAGKIANDF